MVGFAADGASTMFGEKNSVAQKFKRDIPNLFTMKCICHSLALTVSYASKKLPDYLQTLFSDVYCYLKYSSKRQQNLQRFQKIFDIPEHKILKFVKVRWLSLSATVARFIEQYDALYAFFEAESRSKIKKTADKANKIYQNLRNKFTYLYLLFLNHVLPFVNKRNAMFQSESPKIFDLHAEMKSLFKTIVSCYLNEEYVTRTDPELIEYIQQTNENKHNWELLKNIDLGVLVAAEITALLSKPQAPFEEVRKFQENCRSFLIELGREIYQRFSFNELNIRMLEKLSFMLPESMNNFRNINEVAMCFGFEQEALQKEFKLMKFKYLKNSTVDADMITFWKKIVDDEEFPLMKKLADIVFVLPHSSAAVERSFSAINLNKTKFRSRLESATISGILHSKTLGNDLFSLPDECYKSMISFMNSDELYS